jgi:C-terminal processing protease CtpA/Prc
MEPTMHFALMLAAVLNADPDSFQSKNEEAFAKHVMQAAKYISENHVVKATPGQLMAWAIDGAYESRGLLISATMRKRMRSLAKGDDVDIGRLLREVYVDLQLDGNDAVDEAFAGAFGGISRRLEPGATTLADNGTAYIRSRDVPGCRLNGNGPAGVGLKFEVDKKSQMLRVVTPVYGSPAHKAGIRAGDIITHFRLMVDANGKALDKPKLVSTRGMTYDQAVDLIVGPAGTQIDVVIERR